MMLTMYTCMSFFRGMKQFKKLKHGHLIAFIPVYDIILIHVFQKCVQLCVSLKRNKRFVQGNKENSFRKKVCRRNNALFAQRGRS